MIQIIDGFRIGSTSPVDNRFVVGTGYSYATKEEIDYKYLGLRIWDADNSTAFIWNGTTWNPEIMGIVDGTTDYIHKFTNENTVGNSIIVEKYGKIGINHIPNQLSTHTLSVHGSIYSTSMQTTGNVIVGGQIQGSLSCNYLTGTLPHARIGDNSVNARKINVNTLGDGLTKDTTLSDLSKLKVKLDTTSSMQFNSGGIRLIGDLPSPGISKVYGTSNSGIKGWMNSIECRTIYISTTGASYTINVYNQILMSGTDRIYPLDIHLEVYEENTYYDATGWSKVDCDVKYISADPHPYITSIKLTNISSGLYYVSVFFKRSKHSTNFLIQ